MLSSNLFTKRQIENYLISVCGKDVHKSRETMNFIKKLARDVESGYKIGLKDGYAGTPVPEKSQLLPDSSQVSELAKAAVDFAYSAYRAGYLAGKAKRGD